MRFRVLFNLSAAGLVASLTACSTPEFTSEGVNQHKSADGTEVGNGNEDTETTGNKNGSSEPGAGKDAGQDADGGKNDGLDEGGDGTKGDLDSAQEVLELCNSGETKAVTRTIQFPRQQDCRWEEDGNLGERQGYFQARKSQSKQVDVGKDKVVCSVEMQSLSQTFHYDDTVFVLLNDYILMSSHDNVVPKFKKDGNLLKWNFESIKGSELIFEKNESYCFGGNESCEIPGHDQEGPISMDLETEQFSELATKLVNKDTLKFSTVATGDNDLADCFHSDLELQLDMTVVDRKAD